MFYSFFLVSKTYFVDTRNNGSNYSQPLSFFSFFPSYYWFVYGNLFPTSQLQLAHSILNPTLNIILNVLNILVDTVYYNYNVGDHIQTVYFYQHYFYLICVTGCAFRKVTLRTTSTTYSSAHQARPRSSPFCHMFTFHLT